MDIDEQKREILNLLGKLHRGSDHESSRERGEARPEGRASSAQEAYRKRRQELVDLRTRRDLLGQGLLEERLLGICKMLEERISRIESIIERGGRQDGTTRHDGSAHGIDLANHPGVMTPAIDRTDSSPQAPRPRETDPASSRARRALEEPSPSLSGEIQDGILPDIIQLISANSKTGVLTLESPQRRIELYMHNGDMYHASTEGLDGHAAFFAAIALEQGSFRFKETDELHEESTIDEDTQFLILEALRQIDENSNDT